WRVAVLVGGASSARQVGPGVAFGSVPFEQRAVGPGHGVEIRRKEWRGTLWSTRDCADRFGPSRRSSRRRAFVAAEQFHARRGKQCPRGRNYSRDWRLERVSGTAGTGR